MRENGEQEVVRLVLVLIICTKLCLILFNDLMNALNILFLILVYLVCKHYCIKSFDVDKSLAKYPHFISKNFIVL